MTIKVELHSALASVTEKEEHIAKLEGLIAEQNSKLDLLRSESALAADQLSINSTELQAVIDAKEELEGRLEDRDATVAELKEEIARLHRIETDAEDLMNKFSSLQEAWREEEDLRHTLVERNAERDSLHLSLINARLEIEDKQSQLKEAMLQIAENVRQLDEAHLLIESLSQPNETGSAPAQSEGMTEKRLLELPLEKGSPMAGVAAVLLDMHFTAVSLLEDRKQVMNQLQERLDKESRRSAGSGISGKTVETLELESKVTEAAAEREALANRLKRIKRMASAAIEKMRLDMDSLWGVIGDAWDTSSSTSFSARNMSGRLVPSSCRPSRDLQSATNSGTGIKAEVPSEDDVIDAAVAAERCVDRKEHLHAFFFACVLPGQGHCELKLNDQAGCSLL